MEVLLQEHSMTKQIVLINIFRCTFLQQKAKLLFLYQGISRIDVNLLGSI